MTRESITSESVYHIYNRGVEKRDIFMDDGDRIRFIHHLYQLNNTQSAPNLTQCFRDISSEKIKEVQPPLLLRSRRQRERNPLVDILAYVLMPNHYHLMIRQRVDDGVSRFMQRLGTGYTMFFNEKYSRTGALFQGKYKYKRLETDAHFLYLPHYIHMNPLNIGGPTSYIELLEYRWSSLPDYAGVKNFQSVINPREVLDAYGDSDKYIKNLKLFITPKKRSKLSDISDITLDWGEKHEL